MSDPTDPCLQPEEAEPAHPAVRDWTERLTPIVGDWVPVELIALVVDELIYLIGRDLRQGRTVDLRHGRLVADGDEWVWLPAKDL
jgi:hypothetical protein